VARIGSNRSESLFIISSSPRAASFAANAAFLARAQASQLACNAGDGKLGNYHLVFRLAAILVADVAGYSRSRSSLVRPHEPRVARHIGSKDRGKTAFDGLFHGLPQ